MDRIEKMEKEIERIKCDMSNYSAAYLGSLGTLDSLWRRIFTSVILALAINDGIIITASMIFFRA